MKKVLFFFPHNPYPPKTGAHKRSLELLYGLKEAGCQVILASSTHTSEEPWSNASIEAIRKELGCDVRLHAPGLIETWLTRQINKIRRVALPTKFLDYIRRIVLPDGGIQPVLISAGMKRWFNVVSDEFQPDVIFMNYAYFDCIVSKRARMRRTCIMEMHDLVTLNEKMRATIRKVVDMERLAVYPSGSVLDLDFFDQQGFLADPAEFRIYDKYDYTTCISELERDEVQRNSPRTRAVHIPMTHTISAAANGYGGDALFTCGPNPFNLLGYCYFIEKVLPLIKMQQPNFRLVVTGKFITLPRFPDGVRFEGYVDDLNQLYESSRFYVCPVYGGTGLQVKIIEAMAHGLPVVAFKNADNMLSLSHGENGLLAQNAEEFAEYVSTLWADRSLCRRLGEGARKTVAAKYGRDRLVAGLTPLIT